MIRTPCSVAEVDDVFELAFTLFGSLDVEVSDVIGFGHIEAFEAFAIGYTKVSILCEGGFTGRSNPKQSLHSRWGGLAP